MDKPKDIIWSVLPSGLNDIIFPVYTPFYDGNKTTPILDDVYEDEGGFEYDDEDWVDA